MGLAFGELEFQALKTAGAIENIREAFVTRSARRPGADQLAEQLSAGPVEPPSGPTPWFTELARRLQIAGIQVERRMENWPSTSPPRPARLSSWPNPCPIPGCTKA